ALDVASHDEMCPAGDDLNHAEYQLQSAPLLEDTHQLHTLSPDHETHQSLLRQIDDQEYYQPFDFLCENFKIYVDDYYTYLNTLRYEEQLNAIFCLSIVLGSA